MFRRPKRCIHQTSAIFTRVAELDSPCTNYTSKVYGDNHIQTLLYQQKHCYEAECTIQATECENVRDDTCGKIKSNNKQNKSSEEERALKDLQLPAGYELIIDAKNVKYFDHSLNEEMINLFKTHGFTSILSYHCNMHSTGAGMSCLGLMPRSHFSIHSFPEESVLFIDFFSEGEMNLYSLYEDIKGILFDTNQEENFKSNQGDNFDVNVPDVKILWTQCMRGFREEFSDDYDSSMNPLDGEITQDIYGPKDDSTIKKRVVSLKTKYQNVEIVEILPKFHSISHISYVKSLSNDESYESLNKELYRTDKQVFLDGDLQSSLYGEVPYHEAMVHPAMMTHPNPKRVAIIGGGEGATLREVLKHNTVEEVVMVDIDEEFINLCRAHIPEWSDCSDLIGSSGGSCFDDERARVYFQDAFKYFIDRFGDESERNGKPEKEELFDVIIMDACDPMNEFVENLFKNSVFIHSFYNAMTEDGVFVTQIGRSPKGDEGGIDLTGVFKSAAKDVGFESMHIYDEGHTLFYIPWSYLVALKNASMRNRWYRSPAEIEKELQQRILKTHSGKSALANFDGSTMFDYQIPSRVYESVYCRLPLGETLEECDRHYSGFGPNSNLGSFDLSNPYSPIFERHYGELQAAKWKNHSILV